LHGWFAMKHSMSEYVLASACAGFRLPIAGVSGLAGGLLWALEGGVVLRSGVGLSLW
jgi:hypothetical protein